MSPTQRAVKHPQITIVANGANYLIVCDTATGNKAIFCRHCRLTSYNPYDVENRFCGRCRVFHEGPGAIPTTRRS
jgi:hypothetical protein